MSRHPRRLLTLATILLGLLTISVGQASAADTVRLYGTVTGSGSASVAGTDVVVRTPGTSTTVAATTVGSGGQYEITGLNSGTYDVRLTPPASSGYGSTLVAGEKIDADRRLDLQLVSSDSAVWSGVLRDGSGAALRNGSVTVGPVTVAADAVGRFSVRVAAGSYSFSAAGGAVRGGVVTNSLVVNGSVELSGGREQDLVVPTVDLKVRAIGPSGSPISGSRVTADTTWAYSRAYAGNNASTVDGLSFGAGTTANYMRSESAVRTVGDDGTATFVVAKGANLKQTGKVEAPAATTLPAFTFSVDGLATDVTKVFSFSKSASDPTPPTVTCDTSGAGAKDGTWSSEPPRITCTSSDDGTGLADPKDQTVTVTPKVPDTAEYEGTYPADVKVCDKADNCTERSIPVNVDKKAPTLESSTPGKGASYAQGQDVEIHYSCRDGGSGVKVCRPAQPGAPGTGTGSTGGGEPGTKLDTSKPGKYVVYVECTDAAGNTRTETIEYEVKAPEAIAPTSTTAPTLSGTPRVGGTLSASLGGWEGTAPITFSRRWQRCDEAGSCTDIDGATGTTYGPVLADSGKRLRIVVTATNEKGAASRASEASSAVSAAGGFSPNPSAQIAVQKAQAFVSLQAGETRDVSASCPSGTRAVDGSPLVQAVDQDRGTRSDVRVRSSAPSGDGGWAASVHNPTTGQAQVQLFLTCLGTSTSVGGGLSLTDGRTATVPLKGGDTVARTLTCEPGSVAVAPSFDIGDARARLVSSEPSANGNAWSFAVRSTDDGSVALGVRCLSTSLSDGSRLVIASQSSTATIGAGERRTVALDVGDGKAATAAGFSAPTDGSTTLLGREPQGRTALFSYENTSNAPGPVSQTALVLSIVASSPDPLPATDAPPSGASSPAPQQASADGTSGASQTAPATAAASTGSGGGGGTTSGPAPTSVRRSSVPAPTVAAPASVRASSLGGGLTIAVELAQSGPVTTVVSAGGHTLATARTTAKAGTSRIRVALPKRERARLGRAGHRTLRVAVTSAGGTTVRTVKVRR